MRSPLNHSEQDLYTAVLHHGPDILRFCETSDQLELYCKTTLKECLPYPRPPESVNTNTWLIPHKYQTFDIAKYCRSQCKTQDELDRVELELTLFEQYNMSMVLRTMKYIVDTLRENQIVWGVGRGSSVASFCLYLIGVHKIHSIKYNLPLDEFFR